MPNYYHVGARVRLTAVFTNAEGLAIDPDVVVAKYKTPAGQVTALTYNAPGSDALVRLGTGVYGVDVDLDSHGKWWYRFHSTGFGKAAKEGYLLTLDSQFD